MTSSGKIQKTWDPWKVFNVSVEQRKAIEERARMRDALKKEWQKKVTSPYRGPNGYIFDPAVQRFMSMRASQVDYFKVTPKTTWQGFMLFILPFSLMLYWIEKERGGREARFRRGEVSYKDRDWKFV